MPYIGAVLQHRRTAYADRYVDAFAERKRKADDIGGQKNGDYQSPLNLGLITYRKTVESLADLFVEKLEHLVIEIDPVFLLPEAMTFFFLHDVCFCRVPRSF
jgi:hypothetical protein